MAYLQASVSKNSSDDEEIADDGDKDEKSEDSTHSGHVGQTVDRPLLVPSGHLGPRTINVSW